MALRLVIIALPRRSRRTPQPDAAPRLPHSSLDAVSRLAPPARHVAPPRPHGDLRMAARERAGGAPGGSQSGAHWPTANPTSILGTVKSRGLPAPAPVPSSVATRHSSILQIPPDTRVVFFIVPMELAASLSCRCFSSSPSTQLLEAARSDAHKPWQVSLGNGDEQQRTGVNEESRVNKTRRVPQAIFVKAERKRWAVLADLLNSILTGK